MGDLPGVTGSYERDDQAILRSKQVDDEHALGFRAEAIRQERTGVHARLSISLNDIVLAWTTLNIEKDEDRVRLTNSTYGLLNSLAASYPKPYLKKDLDLFCAGLWDEQLKAFAPEELAGSLEARPPDLLLSPYILRGGGTILFAPPGRGKSYAMLLMAASLHAGISSVWPTRKVRVLFINLERSRRSIADRIGNVNEVLGLDRGTPLPVMNARGRSLSDILPAARRYVRERQIECVLLDSISRAGFGDLTENAPVNRIVDGLNGLCDTWAALAHTPRSDESHVYGSVHFEAGADVVVQLTSQQEEGGPLGVGLQITKQNDIGAKPLAIIALEFGPTGLSGVRHARRGEFPEIEQNRKMSLRQQVREFVLDHGKATATMVAEGTGLNRANVSHLFANDASFVRVEKIGKETFYGAAVDF